MASRRVRAALCLGMLFALGWTGTMASWTDQATMTGGTFTAGTLDIGLDGNLAGAGGTWANTQLQLANMLPGESIADDFQAQNVGTVPLVFRASAVANGALAPQLRFSVTTGAAAINSTDAQGNRTGVCPAGTTWLTNSTLSAAPTTVVGTDVTIAAGAALTMCVSVALDASAPSASQGATATTSFSFNARQVGSPP